MDERTYSDHDSGPDPGSLKNCCAGSDVRGPFNVTAQKRRVGSDHDVARTRRERAQPAVRLSD